MSDKDKREIVTYLKLVDARHRAGEDVCISCYIKKVMDILNKCK
jgi:hypothetical protein